MKSHKNSFKTGLNGFVLPSSTHKLICLICPLPLNEVQISGDPDSMGTMNFAAAAAKDGNRNAKRSIFFIRVFVVVHIFADAE